VQRIPHGEDTGGAGQAAVSTAFTLAAFPTEPARCPPSRYAIPILRRPAIGTQGGMVETLTPGHAGLDAGVSSSCISGDPAGHVGAAEAGPSRDTLFPGRPLHQRIPT
jgi:hypothetical protein